MHRVLDFPFTFHGKLFLKICSLNSLFCKILYRLVVFKEMCHVTRSLACDEVLNANLDTSFSPKRTLNYESCSTTVTQQPVFRLCPE